MRRRKMRERAAAAAAPAADDMVGTRFDDQTFEVSISYLRRGGGRFWLVELGISGVAIEALELTV